MRLIHHVSENLNQGYSQKYNNTENIRVDNNELIILEIILENGITIVM